MATRKRSTQEIRDDYEDRLRRYKEGESYDTTLKSIRLTRWYFNSDESFEEALKFRKEKAKAKNREMQARWREANPVRHLYTKRMAVAKRRDILWSLTLEDCESLYGKPCAYCGSDTTLNLDRIDNDLGYEVDNVQPCCVVCNRMKETMDSKEFLSHIQRIAHYSLFSSKQGTTCK